MTSRNKLLLMVLGLGLLAAAGFAASRLLPLGEWLDALVAWAAEVGPLGAILVGLLYIPVCILVLPATALTYTLAFAFGLWPAFFATVLGATLGASAVFLLGRHLAGLAWRSECLPVIPMVARMGGGLCRRDVTPGKVNERGRACVYGYSMRTSRVAYRVAYR